MSHATSHATSHAMSNEGAARQLHTIADFIRYGASRFNAAGLHFGHGTDNAVDDAQVLVLHALHLDHGLAPELYHARLTDDEKAAVLALFRERIETRKPAAYLTGEAWFAGLRFAVDERVIVPRSPVAELVAERFVPWVEPGNVHRILDLCTGSGCIAVACALAFPGAEVDATDISDDALEVARANVAAHHVDDRVRLVRSDIYDGLAGERYDLIVTNPPYVDAEDMASLPQEYRREPELALASGADGLDATRRILHGAADHLSPGGVLVGEVGNSRHALADAFPGLPLVWVDLARGGDGLFVVGADDLAQLQEHLAHVG